MTLKVRVHDHEDINHRMQTNISGCYMEYISGAADNYLDSITFHYVCP